MDYDKESKLCLLEEEFFEFYSDLAKRDEETVLEHITKMYSLKQNNIRNGKMVDLNNNNNNRNNNNIYSNNYTNKIQTANINTNLNQYSTSYNYSNPNKNVISNNNYNYGNNNIN